MSAKETKCPICTQNHFTETYLAGSDKYKVNCKICGDYEISGSLFASENMISREKAYLLSAFCRDKSLKGEVVSLDAGNFEKIINIASKIAKGFESEDDVLNKILVNIYEKTMQKHSNSISFYIPQDYPLFYLKSPEEFGYYIHFLVNPLNYLKQRDKDYSLTKEGFERVKEIKNVSSNVINTEMKSDFNNSNNVFVAMAFSKKTNNYRKLLKKIIEEETRYNCIIVDEEHFNGNIMEKIHSEIRNAKFVIADFTVSPEIIENDAELSETSINRKQKYKVVKVKNGVRGGVYYEAGFAKGLGLQVIHTCKDDEESKHRIHFDILQENTIFWSDKDLQDTEIRNDEERQKGNSEPQNFSEKLYDRIKFIFGLGKNISE